MRNWLPLLPTAMLVAACGATPGLQGPSATSASYAAASHTGDTPHYGLGCKLDGLPVMTDDEPAGQQDEKTRGALPTHVDLRSGCTPMVRNQGYTEACVAFATTALAEFLLRKDHHPELLSPLYIWSLTRHVEGSLGKNEGTAPSDAIKLGHELGFLPDSAMPFPEGVLDTAPDFAKMLAWRPTAAIEGDAKKLRPINGVQLVSSVHALKKRLADGLPSVICFSVFSNIKDAHQTGVVPMPTPNDKLEGGHAVLCVGYDNPGKRLIFRNSWSANWGDGGYGYLPYDFLKAGLLRQGVTANP